MPITAMSILALSAFTNGAEPLTVEFDAPFDPALVKKFGVFNSGLTDWQHYDRDAQWLGRASSGFVPHARHRSSDTRPRWAKPAMK